jgi:hypothetical protein
MGPEANSVTDLLQKRHCPPLAHDAVKGIAVMGLVLLVLVLLDLLKHGMTLVSVGLGWSSQLAGIRPTAP